MSVLLMHQLTAFMSKKIHKFLWIDFLFTCKSPWRCKTMWSWRHTCTCTHHVVLPGHVIHYTYSKMAKRCSTTGKCDVTFRENYKNNTFTATTVCSWCFLKRRFRLQYPLRFLFEAVKTKCRKTLINHMKIWPLKEWRRESTDADLLD